MHPNMRVLTEQQLCFVVEYTSGEGAIGNASEAARRAGYSPRSAAEIARQLLDKPHVRAAVDTAIKEQFGGRLAVKAVAVLEGLLDNPKVSDKVRLDTAKAVLDRAGIVARPAPAAPAENPLDAMSIEELQAMLAQVRQETGYYPAH
jgi:phage terminase small subunit